jgi:glyoxylase-like metal-dependent hydrolase (beta-lactamase superfamily II)
MTRLPALHVNRVVNLPFGSNTYLLTRLGSPNCLVIDPGDGADSRLAGRVEKYGGRIEYALLTHEHYDHISSLPALKEYWNCQVICSRECSVAITDPTRNFSRYLVQRDVVCGKADLVCEDLGWSLDWCGGRVRFIPTPGHSPGSICIAIENLLFTGDCLLPNSKRVTNLPGGNKKALEKSLTLLLDTFNPETLVYPGHGEPFQLKDAIPLPAINAQRHDRHNQ